MIQAEFPQLEKTYWGKHFWSIGYAAFSSGHVIFEMIRDYLTNHEKHPNQYDENFQVERKSDFQSSATNFSWIAFSRLIVGRATFSRKSFYALSVHSG